VDDGFFSSLIISVITAVTAQNTVFARALGVSAAATAAKSKRNLPGVCLGVAYFSIMASAAAWVIYGRTAGTATELKKPFVPLIYVLVIGFIYLLTLMLALIFFKGKFGRIKKYVHISAFNSAIMGTIFLSMSTCSALYEFLLFGLCSGAGFAAAAYMLSGVYGQLCSDKVPSAFRGYPAVMIFTGIIAMALYGILGHVPSYI